MGAFTPGEWEFVRGLLSREAGRLATSARTDRDCLELTLKRRPIDVEAIDWWRERVRESEAGLAVAEAALAKAMRVEEAAGGDTSVPPGGAEGVGS
jgi:hypothetical protein